MTVRNVSELLFEKFCNGAGIGCLPISTQRETRTPDYEIMFGSLKVIVEVKEIERNAEERESDRLLEIRGYGNATGGMPGQRVRKKIWSSSAQIKERTRGIHPGILVLHDPYYGINIEPYHILVAMYGLETFMFAVPEIGPAHVAARKFGPKRKMTCQENTSISAIATLLHKDVDRYIFNLYHNKFAAIPLPEKELSSYPISQFRLRDNDSDDFGHWERVV